MGVADAIPGVSGGTVALILGIYERLVGAISRFDRKLLADLLGGRVRSAAEHIDLRFLVSLALGIAVGIIGLLQVMNSLLTDPAARPITLAVFFGAIVASSWLVARTIRVWGARLILGYVLLGVVGAAAAFATTQVSPSDVQQPSLVYLFCCGLIAICAMILPGISGAYLLLVLGVYVYMTGVLKALAHGDVDQQKLLVVAVFCSGCAIGLLSFSKFLRWLLAHYHSATMAVLCGFMIGALGRVWPFQEEIGGNLGGSQHPQLRAVLPEQLDAHVLVVFLAAIGAGLFVLTVDRIVRYQSARADVSRAARHQAEPAD